MRHNTKSHYYNFQKDKKFHKKTLPIKENEKIEWKKNNPDSLFYYDVNFAD